MKTIVTSILLVGLLTLAIPPKTADAYDYGTLILTSEEMGGRI